MLRNEYYKKIVIKIGTNVISQENGTLDLNIIENLVRQIAELKKLKVKVIVVSSGAVGAGRSLINIAKEENDVVRRQILASIGQPKLIDTFSGFFAKHGYICAQILATKEDFRDRVHYLNMKNCFSALLQDDIVPVVNENDVVSISELMFTDNDELAGLIASMMNVDSLFLLTNVEGIYNGNPKDINSRLIRTVNPNDTKFMEYISPEKSNFGRGGMLTKSNIAHKLSLTGISTHIANGKKDGVILNLYKQKEEGTRFAAKKQTSNIKKWLAYSEGYEKGKVFINKGAETALSSGERANSLLPVGITRVEGNFEKGDLLQICNENNQKIGIGLAQYNSQKANSVIGLKSQKALIHYDYLFLKK